MATSNTEVELVNVQAAPGLRRVPTQQRGRDRVAAILDAAATLVVTHGADALNTRAICDASGVPIATLYQYFDDREGVLLALIDRDMQRMDTQVITDLTAMTEWTIESFVRTAINAFVTIHLSSPAFVEIYLRGRGTRAIDDYGHQHNKSVAVLLHDLVTSEGLVRPDTPVLTAELILEVGDRILQLAFAESYQPDMDVIEEGISMICSHLTTYATPAAAAGIPRPAG